MEMYLKIIPDFYYNSSLSVTQIVLFFVAI